MSSMMAPKGLAQSPLPRFSSTTPINPKHRPSHSERTGQRPQSPAKSEIHKGAVAIQTAATLDGTHCSAVATPPIPPPIRSIPTAVGILLIGGGMGGVATAEQWVPSSVAAVCIATAPLWISLFAGLWGRWPVRSEWLGLCLGFIGVVLLNLGSGLWASPLGAIILLIAPVCWAFGSAWSHHLQLPSGLMASATQML